MAAFSFLLVFISFFYFFFLFFDLIFNKKNTRTKFYNFVCTFFLIKNCKFFAIRNSKGHNHSLSRRDPLFSFRYAMLFNLSAVILYCSFPFLVNFICYLLFHPIYLVLYYHLLRFGETNFNEMKMNYAYFI